MTDDRYEDAMALARQMAEERDRRFEQLKQSEAEADRLRREVRVLREENRSLQAELGLDLR